MKKTSLSNSKPLMMKYKKSHGICTISYLLFLCIINTPVIKQKDPDIQTLEDKPIISLILQYYGQKIYQSPGVQLEDFIIIFFYQIKTPFCIINSQWYLFICRHKYQLLIYSTNPTSYQALHIKLESLLLHHKHNIHSCFLCRHLPSGSEVCLLAGFSTRQTLSSTNIR